MACSPQLASASPHMPSEAMKGAGGGHFKKRQGRKECLGPGRSLPLRGGYGWATETNTHAHTQFYHTCNDPDVVWSVAASSQLRPWRAE